MNKKKLNIIKLLQEWYSKYQRPLLFRETQDPYSIWVSEIMLQQTKVETVLPYYKKFMHQYPNIEALSKAKEEDLLKLVEGIGYYRRFKNLLKAAKVIQSQMQGIFPSDYKSILDIPGIGEYTAGAMMSIAFNKPYAATDGNVVRVLSRVYNVKENMRLAKNKKHIQNINQELIEKATPRIYTQAMMELGALICLPRNPKCSICPIKENCIAFKKSLQQELPLLSKPPSKQRKHYVCLIICKEDKIHIKKRTEKLLEGMFEYPQYLLETYEQVEEVLSSLGVKVSLISKVKKYKHIFTHQVWTIDVYRVRLDSDPLEEWIPVSIDQLFSYPMAKAHRQIKIES